MSVLCNVQGQLSLAVSKASSEAPTTILHTCTLIALDTAPLTWSSDLWVPVTQLGLLLGLAQFQFLPVFQTPILQHSQSSPV